MKLRNVRLTLANIAPTTNAKSLVVNEVAEIKERGADGKATEKTIGYSATCMARRDTITVKFSLDVKEEWEKLKRLLENDVLVEISFTDLKLTPFALVSSSGQLVSGIAARAQSFQIVKNGKDDLFDEIPDEEVQF